MRATSSGAAKPRRRGSRGFARGQLAGRPRRRSPATTIRWRGPVRDRDRGRAQDAGRALDLDVGPPIGRGRRRRRDLGAAEGPGWSWLARSSPEPPQPARGPRSPTQRSRSPGVCACARRNASQRLREHGGGPGSPTISNCSGRQPGRIIDRRPGSAGIRPLSGKDTDLAVRRILLAFAVLAVALSCRRRRRRSARRAATRSRPTRSLRRPPRLPRHRARRSAPTA